MDISTEINSHNRTTLSITDYDFLKAFKEEGERIFFKLIHEQKRIAKSEDCILTDKDKDEYPFLQEVFQRYQRKGYAVYFVVNSGGTKKDTITRINAHFLDLDYGKIPKYDNNGKIIKDEKKTVYEYRTANEIENYKIECLKNLKNFALYPNIIVETKNGFHIYWLIEQQSKKDLVLFTPLQVELMNYFKQYESYPEHVDASAKSIERVLRIPNYYHLKDPNDPFLVKCIHFDISRKYTQEELASAIGVSVADLENYLTAEKQRKNIKKPTKGHPISQIESVPNAISHKKAPIGYTDIITTLRSIDIRHYLGINCELNQNFKCIFHDDKHPSAQINLKGNSYKYFCYSSNCSCNTNKGMDIIDIVMMQKNCSTSDAIKYLTEYYNLSVSFLDIDWAQKQKEKYHKNIDIINSLQKYREKYPYLNRILRYAYPYIQTILSIALDNIVCDLFKIDGEALFFFSNRYLAKKSNKTLDRTNKYINLLCVLGLLVKVPYNNINDKIVKKAKEISKKNKEQGICFYTIPDYASVLDIAEERAKTLITYRFSIKGMSRTYIANVFGQEIADQVYHVHIKPSTKNYLVQESIENFILQQVHQVGYCTKDMVINQSIIVNGVSIKKHTKDFEFRRILPDILQKYSLVYVKANKEINSKLNINTFKYIIVKEELISMLRQKV